MEKSKKKIKAADKEILFKTAANAISNLYSHSYNFVMMPRPLLFHACLLPSLTKYTMPMVPAPAKPCSNMRLPMNQTITLHVVGDVLFIYSSPSFFMRL
jgi:hypothetical protein